MTLRRFIGLGVAGLVACAFSTALAVVASGDPPGPTASFGYEPAAPLKGETVTFTSTSVAGEPHELVAWDWDLDNDGVFGDQTGPDPTTAEATFATVGPHTVSLQVTDNHGETSTVSKAVIVINQPPTAALTASPDSVLTGETVSFDASGSSDRDGTVDKYEWDLDGNTDNGFEVDTGSSSTTSKAYTDVGTITARVRVTDSDAGTAEASTTVTVRNQSPRASFSVSSAAPQTLEDVTFTSTSSDPDGTIQGQSWDLDDDGEFDDGSELSATRSFPASGQYTIRLRVIDDDGGTDVAAVTLSVSNRSPTASFVFSPEQPLTKQSVTFTGTSTDPDGSIQSRAWDLDDDGSFDDGTGISASREFPTAGSYTVRLRVVDNDGTADVAVRTVHVENRAPTASFSVSSFPQTLDPVTFTSTSTDVDGTIQAFAWDLDNDGLFDDGSGSSATRAFPTTGPYTVRLQVTDDKGGVDTSSEAITMGNRAPKADFDAPASPQTLENVVFRSTATDPDGTIQSQRWDLDDDGAFDDGGGTTASRIFPTAGPYTVKLEVIDNDNGSDVMSKTITVGNRAPSAGIAVSDSSPKTFDQVTFTSEAADPDGSIQVEAWELDGVGNFDDGTGPTASRTFTTPGVHTVRLRVTDNSGASTVAAVDVVVQNQPPIAKFAYSPESPAPFEKVTFVSESGDPDGTLQSQAWDLDNDGQFDDGAGATAQRSFKAAETYIVRLRVVDDLGLTSIAEQPIVVGNRAPVASFGFNPGAPVAGDMVRFFSTSTDPDTPIVEQTWDLNGDGVFGDATGPSTARSFEAAGTYTVSLGVTDSEGAWAVATETIAVSVKPPPPRVTQTSAGTGLLSPFPVVRLSGSIKRRGARLRRFSVMAPAGATVTVSCRGRGCPFRRQTKKAKPGAEARGGTTPTTRLIRVRKLERRLLRAGIVLKVFVTKPGTIGKYTQFKMRRGKPPNRVDGCLTPGSTAPVQCPSS